MMSFFVATGFRFADISGSEPPLSLVQTEPRRHEDRPIASILAWLQAGSLPRALVACNGFQRFLCLLDALCRVARTFCFEWYV